MTGIGNESGVERLACGVQLSEPECGAPLQGAEGGLLLPGRRARRLQRSQRLKPVGAQQRDRERDGELAGAPARRLGKEIGRDSVEPEQQCDATDAGAVGSRYHPILQRIHQAGECGARAALRQSGHRVEHLRQRCIQPRECYGIPRVLAQRSRNGGHCHACFTPVLPCRGKLPGRTQRGQPPTHPGQSCDCGGAG